MSILFFGIIDFGCSANGGAPDEQALRHVRGLWRSTTRAGREFFANLRIGKNEITIDRRLPLPFILMQRDGPREILQVKAPFGSGRELLQAICGGPDVKWITLEHDSTRSGESLTVEFFSGTDIPLGPSDHNLNLCASFGMSR